MIHLYLGGVDYVVDVVDLHILVTMPNMDWMRKTERNQCNNETVF